ncbi:CCA tRNA nucleotidyltransferase [Candidatus Peregrinibacteria bacterium]|nr:CCA tRNA nucleotidyltransferase [Candidatus Peregrinibacteria bacterium]
MPRMPLSKSIIARTLETPRGEHAYSIVEKLTDAGFDAWWVGGAVRQMLQEEIPKDIDIATSATPEQIENVFAQDLAEGAVHGSVRVRMGKDTFEVTTFREDDAASDGRHPESVVFGTREQDAKRRDFTINALYWHPISRELYDPFEGTADLQEKLIRFIGDPTVRIRHDALRLPRAVRFRSLLNGQYHPETYRSLQELADKVLILSGSRQREEMEKMLLGPHPDRALEDLREFEMLAHFLPELSVCKGIPQPADFHHEGDVWEHMMMVLRSFREDDDIDVRLAALFHDCGKAETFSLKERIRFDHHAQVSAQKAEAALGRLQYPRKRIEKISWMIAHHMMMTAFLEMPESRKAHWYFHPWFNDLVKLMYLDIAGTDPADYSLYDRILNDQQHFLDAHPRPQKPLLSGDEIMRILGIGSGARVGEILSMLHEAQLRGELTTKKEARAFVERLKGT